MAKKTEIFGPHPLKSRVTISLKVFGHQYFLSPLPPVEGAECLPNELGAPFLLPNPYTWDRGSTPGMASQELLGLSAFTAACLLGRCSILERQAAGPELADTQHTVVA